MERIRLGSIVLVFFALSRFSTAEEVNNAELQAKIEALNGKVSRVSAAINQTRREVIAAFMADKTEQITAGCRSDDERVKAIAMWIGRNYHNTSDREPNDSGRGVEGFYALRLGPCAPRSLTHQRMADFVGIPGKVLNIYSMGHTTLQLFYDNSWHFYDIQNGVYFEKDGRVLDFFELLADPSLATVESGNRRLIPLVNTSWGGADKRVHKVVEVDHKKFFTPKDFSEMDGEVKYYFDPSQRCRIKARLDVAKFLNPGPLRYGEPGTDLFDNHRIEMHRDGLGWYLGRYGSYSDYMDHRIFFNGAKPGEKFRITIIPYRFTGGVDAKSHWCEVKGFKILKGECYAGQGNWVIELEAEKDDPEITLCNNIDKPGLGFSASVIEFARIQ